MASERKSIISAVWDRQAGNITFGVAGIGNIVLDVFKVAGGAEVVQMLSELGQTGLYHGYEQKVRDAAAIPRNVKTGASASPQEKFDAMENVVAQLHDGQWNIKGRADLVLNRAALFEAVAEVRDVEASAVEAKFRDRPDEVLRAFLTHGDIAAAYARRTTRDTGAAEKLFAELM